MLKDPSNRNASRIRRGIIPDGQTVAGALAVLEKRSECPVLERERVKVKGAIDRLWEKFKALDEEIAAAAQAGKPIKRLRTKQEKLRARSWALAERSWQLDVPLSELSVVANAEHGRGQRTSDEPF